MKILRVASDLYPSVVGGYGLHAHYMSRLQAEMGHQVTVLTFKVDGRPAEETVDGYHVVRIKPMLRLYGNSIQPFMLVRLMRGRKKYDIIHAHSHIYLSTNLCALVRKLGSARLVVTSHGFLPATSPRWLQDIFIPTVARWTFRAADMVICYTEEERSLIIGLGVDSKKVRVIHNGIDTALFHPPEKKARTGRILWVGRYVPGKRVDVLIDAFATARRAHPGLTLMLVGTGPQKGLIKEKIRALGLEGSVLMRDFVPNTEMPSVYQGADVFALSSTTEGVPRTILEAMSCGVPVVCSSLPHLARIVDGCGLPVPPKDSGAMAAAMLRLVEDGKLADTLGEAGRARVLREYSWDDTVRKTVALYEEMLGSGETGPYPGGRA